MNGIQKGNYVYLNCLSLVGKVKFDFQSKLFNGSVTNEREVIHPLRELGHLSKKHLAQQGPVNISNKQPITSLNLTSESWYQRSQLRAAGKDTIAG